MTSDDAETVLLIDKTQRGDSPHRPNCWSAIGAGCADGGVSAGRSPRPTSRPVRRGPGGPARRRVKLDAYLHERPLPFYPWLHRLAAEQIAHVHRRHLQTQRAASAASSRAGRSSPMRHLRHLIDRLAASQTSPSQRACRKEQRPGWTRRWRSSPRRTARSWCCATWRSCFGEIAAVLGITEGPPRSATSGPWSGSAACWTRTVRGASR